MVDLQELRRLAEQASKNSFVSYGNKREQEYAERCRERLNSAAHPCAVLELLDEIERLQESAADKTKDIAYYHEQLAAAKARVEELEKDNARQKRLATISRLCKNVQDCRAEKAETKIKQMEDAIKFDFERFVDFQRRAEQAEAQCAAMETAINRYVLGNIALLDAMKAALEEKP